MAESISTNEVADSHFELKKELSQEYLEDDLETRANLALASSDDNNWQQPINEDEHDPPKTTVSKFELEDDSYLKHYEDIKRHNIIEVSGTDRCGRVIICVYACRLPPSHEIDHQRFLGYIRHVLDRYVESDYTLIYFHYGLKKRNKPSFAWLRQAYKDFDRKYKKNVKAFYIVHPSNFIRFVWYFFKPIISAKFGRKVVSINYISELESHVYLSNLTIPANVLKYDGEIYERYVSRLASKPSLHGNMTLQAQSQPTNQFRMSIEFIQKNNPDSTMIPVVQRCVEFIRKNGLNVEGIFRLSANYSTMLTVKKSFDAGEKVDFFDCAHGNCASVLAAVTLKAFLRDMPEPIMTFDLFKDVCDISRLPKIERPDRARTIVQELLPRSNYLILAYILELLYEIVQRSDVNLMLPNNLSIVIGPNLAWSKNEAITLGTMGPVIIFTEVLITNFEDIFS